MCHLGTELLGTSELYLGTNLLGANGWAHSSK